MLLSEAVAFVREHRETWAPEAKGYATTVFNIDHCLRILGDLEVETIRPFHFAKIVKALKEEGKQAGTINRVQSALSTVLNTLYKYELLDRKIPYTQLREPRGRTKFYTEEQLLKLYIACSKLPEDAELVTDIVMVAAKTGARQGELLKLTWETVDFASDTVCFLDTKTHEDREIPMLGEVREVLKRRYADRIDDERVFPIHKDRLLRRLKRAQRMAGIEDTELLFHSLRHTAASLLFANGAELPVVMSIMGHKCVGTSMRYSHATKEGVERALGTL